MLNQSINYNGGMWRLLLCVMNRLQSVAVFCGSSAGEGSIYEQEAHNAGRMIATHGARLVYGGSRIGLMGAVAAGAMSADGEVIGVIPSFLKTKEIAHRGITRLITVESMHERKTLMHELSDAIIALPGGFGTMEELFEMLTWAQLGLHSKPIGILNVGGFYDGLLALVDTMVGQGFLKQDNADMLLVSEDIQSLWTMLSIYEAPLVPKWITESRT